MSFRIIVQGVCTYLLNRRKTFGLNLGRSPEMERNTGMAFEFEILYALQNIRTDWLDMLMKSVSSLGDTGWFWVTLGVVFVCMERTRKTGAMVLASLLVGAVIGNLLLKPMIARPRPCWLDETVVLLVSSPGDYSFPSGHSMASFEAATGIFIKNRRWGIAALALAAMIAFSRMYLFVHFPSDVLAGILLGIGIALLVWRAALQMEKKNLQC